MEKFEQYFKRHKLLLEADEKDEEDEDAKDPKKILGDLPKNVKKYDPEESKPEEEKGEKEEKPAETTGEEPKKDDGDFDWGDEQEESSEEDAEKEDDNNIDEDPKEELEAENPTEEQAPAPEVGGEFKNYFIGTDDFDTKFINEDNITVRFGKELDGIRNQLNNLRTTEVNQESPLFPEMVKVVKNLVTDTFNRVLEATQSNVARFRKKDQQAVQESDETNADEEPLMGDAPEADVAGQEAKKEPEAPKGGDNHITNFFGLAKRVYLTVGNEIVSNDSLNSLKNVSVYSWLPAMEEALMDMVQPPEKKDMYGWDDIKSWNSTSLLVAKALFDEDTDLAKVRTQYNKKINAMFDDAFGAQGFAPVGSEQQA